MIYWWCDGSVGVVMFCTQRAALNVVFSVLSGVTLIGNHWFH